MNRGSPLDSCRRYSGWKCFNEAPIHESGKFSREINRSSRIRSLQ